MAVIHSVLGLDVGDRRIGVARASLEARLAQPLVTLDRQADDSDIFDRLADLVKEQDAGAVVVGLPRGLGGQDTTQTEIARAFAAKLEKRLGLPVHLQDEATTSIMAEEELQRSKKAYQKGDIDKLAACYILRDWLETSGANLV